MTTARICQGLIVVGAAAALDGASSAKIGGSIIQSLGYLEDVAISSLVKESALGALTTGAIQGAAHGLFNKPLIDIKSEMWKLEYAGIRSFTVTGLQLLGQGLLCFSGHQKQFPTAQVAFALLIGNAAIQYSGSFFIKILNDKIEQEEQKKLSLKR